MTDLFYTSFPRMILAWPTISCNHSIVHHNYSSRNSPKNFRSLIFHTYRRGYVTRSSFFGCGWSVDVWDMVFSKLALLIFVDCFIAQAEGWKGLERDPWHIDHNTAEPVAFVLSEFRERFVSDINNTGRGCRDGCGTNLFGYFVVARCCICQSILFIFVLTCIVYAI